MPNVIFPQISRLFYSFVYYITKNYLPLLQQIIDSLKKIGLVGTLLTVLRVLVKLAYISAVC